MKLKSFLPLLFLLSLAISSCITTYYGANYKYTYSLTDTSNKIVLDTTGIMHFEDSVITVDFSIGQKQISFVMKNTFYKIWNTRESYAFRCKIHRT